VYLTDGALVEPDDARERPLAAAAANWHALAAWSARHVRHAGLLIDVGSTTIDVIPILGGQPAARGRTDPERLVQGELIYTGVWRSPVCGVSPAIPWRGGMCPAAQELFATTGDAHVVIGNLPEDPACTATADGRPATRTAARDRLARIICADRTMFTEQDALAAARQIADDQVQLAVNRAKQVVGAMSAPPADVVVSGQGEFLARQIAERIAPQAQVVAVGELLGVDLSRVATAHALAILAREHWSP
jgi:probable H4MPT-linked C1 transfer pathway protein